MEKFNFQEGQTVYYIDWQDDNKKYPAYILQVKRTRASIKIYKEIFRWDTWDVPMEDLEATNDFEVTPWDSLIGQGISFSSKEKRKEIMEVL
tara:strand:- start:280 stop:555 length:276 start_codon:yes stop_codon:yes gene_type:complete